MTAQGTHKQQRTECGQKQGEIVGAGLMRQKGAVIAGQKERRSQDSKAQISSAIPCLAYL